jgi:hypothetical protein
MTGTVRKRTSWVPVGRGLGALLAAALALLAVGPASGPGGDQSACQAQAKRLCSNLSSDAARDRCILQRELECEDSGPSNVVRQRVNDPVAGMRNACRKDFGRVCADLGSDASRPRILRCLREHHDEVSDPCRMALSLEAEATRSPDRDECRTQIRKICPGALGSEALRECLRTSGDSLDEECRRALARRAAGGDAPRSPKGQRRQQP